MIGPMEEKGGLSQDHAPSTSAAQLERAALGEAFADLCAEFAKPQFMTTTNGPASIQGMQRYTVEFTFVGERGQPGGHEARQRRDDLHAAFRKLAAAVNP